MTARSSPHYAAVRRAQVRRKGEAHARANRRVIRSLQDRPKTEAEKAERWRRLWK